MFSGYYICKIMVVIACFLIKAGVTPSSVVTNCKILHGCKIWSGKLPQWLSYTISNR